MSPCGSQGSQGQLDPHAYLSSQPEYTLRLDGGAGGGSARPGRMRPRSVPAGQLPGDGPVLVTAGTGVPASGLILSDGA